MVALSLQLVPAVIDMGICLHLFPITWILIWRSCAVHTYIGRKTEESDSAQGNNVNILQCDAHSILTMKQTQSNITATKVQKLHVT